MHVEFYGATGRITGSCHILRSSGHTVLIDCGLIQGTAEDEALNREAFPFEPRDIDAVVLSHGHIDHSGRLPLLVRQGFDGPIYTQHATRDLALVLLQDSARLAEHDVRYINRKRAEKNLEPIEPLYRVEDAVAAVNSMVPLPYETDREILPGMTIRFHDAGHILGSAIVTFMLSENGVKRTLVFSGDLGQYDTPILNDPAMIEQADAVIIESTYGDRLHRERDETLQEIGRIFRDAWHEGGNILIPAFAIGRSQELLYLFAKYGREWELDRWQIFLDSPMAIEASAIYWDHPELYDEEARLFRSSVTSMPKPRNLHFTRAVEDSRKINDIRQGAIIIAGSGMCNGGRILYHLKHNLGRSECRVVITGYQADGTPGRGLVDGDETMHIHGQEYRVAARVHTLGGLSAHGDQRDLLRWANGFKSMPRFFVVHGESESKRALSEKLRESTGCDVSVPGPGEIVDLASV